ncbi:MAG: deoxyribose-phosphate aldolase [Lachnospiraceae bacterium]|nr:deoxyribose-phosphate aldolase [Lachnospiraceae bacterium]
MTNQEILKHCDHTLLKPVATWEGIRTLCEEAVSCHTASVCVPPCYIARIHETFPELNICTVVGFPLGYETLAGKLAETKQALLDGANEVDMVINITDVKNGNYDAVTEEIRSLKQCCGQKILKVIVETCYLTEEEKIAVCKCVTDGGADYIKTSTGFGTAGATLADVELFKKHIGSSVKIKAAGGIRTIEDLNAYLEAGCERIGTSAAVALLKDSV